MSLATLALVALASSGASSGPHLAAVPEAVRVALVEDGSRPADPAAAALVEALRDLREAGTVRFPEELRFRGDGTPAGVARALEGAWTADGVDLVVAVGAIGSHLAVSGGAPPVPTIAARVLDAGLQELPTGPPGSGVVGLAYLASAIDPSRDVPAFRELAPLERAVLLVPGWVEAIVPALPAGIAERFGAAGVAVEPRALGDDVAATVAALPDDLDAVLVLPLFADAGELARALANADLPSLALLGSDGVRDGLFAGLAPGVDDGIVAARAADHVRAILAGEPPGRLPTLLGRRYRLAVHEGTARRLGLEPSWSVLAEADLVGGAATEAPVLVLEDAMREALAANPGLRAAELALLSGVEEVVRARADLRPQLDLGLAWTLVDEDQAFLGRAERTWTGRVAATQTLWSEPAFANLDLQQLLQESRASDQEALALDTARDAGVAYLDVLRAKTLERIRSTDLSLTRSNLELAHARYDAGVGVQADVFRWESRLATGRRDVLDARAAVRLAELELNRLLHRPLEERALLPPVSLADPALRVDGRVAGALDDPWSFRVFLDLQADRGLALSPELASLDTAIRAQERALRSARRAHWQPTVFAEGALTDVLDAAGEGSTLPAALQAFTSVAEPERTSWTASLVAAFPLYTGGAKRAAERQARHELVRLRTERDALVTAVEARVRAAAELVAAAHASIGLSQDAADAARGNLELVTDSYERGVVSIVDLLDAQDAALIAEASEANAVVDCAVRLLELQRAVGSFVAFEDDEGHAAWRDALEARLEAQRAVAR